MRYMMIMRPTAEAVAASKDVSFDEMLTTMGRYNDELIAAGAMVSGEGLAPPEDGGFVLDFDSDPPTVTAGAYGDRDALFDGFWIIEVASREEAEKWALKCPLGPGVKLEMRRIPTVDEFPQDNEYVQKEKAWRDEHEK